MCEQCIRICNAIGELTDREVASVTIHHSNPDFYGPNEIIDCSGYWTNGMPVRFEGDTKVEALEKAVAAKRVHDDQTLDK